MSRDALRYYPELSADQMHWVLIEATQRILPEVDPDMGAYTVKELLRRLSLEAEADASRVLIRQ